MIGTHNTFTYLSPVKWIFRLFKIFWRCQTKTIQEQYQEGSRFFDFRVYWNKKKNAWGISHGAVNVGVYFSSAFELSSFMNTNFPDAIYRVFLEKGTDEYLEKFKSEFLTVASINPNLCCVGSRGPWRILYKSIKYPKVMKDYCVRVFCWDPDETVWQNLHHLKPFSVLTRKVARANIPGGEITQEMINDPDVLYFIDLL